MPSRPILLFFCSSPFFLGLLLSDAAVADELPATYFADEVGPILETHCLECHAGPDAKAGLRLTDRTFFQKGGDSGSILDADEIDDSLLLSVLNYQSYEMPPSGKLPQALIDKIRRWVAAGAPWPENVRLTVNTTSSGGEEDEGESKMVPPPVNAQTKRHWAFLPISRPNIPKVGDHAWPRNAIDWFLLPRMQVAGLSPSLPSPRQAFLRRATFDLIGLPPSSEEIDAFTRDGSPDAVQRLVDRLLDSPHYGEKWGRHWLDLVRFAETNSYERDAAKPNAWRYRDYVVESFNHDKPYDQFVREQLAGDELPSRTHAQLIATGYYRLGAWDDEPSDPEQAHYDDLDDILSTTAQTFLGLTINCARCHDHKLDPIPQVDYYRLLAFFAGVTRYGGPGGGRDLQYSQVPLGSQSETVAHQAQVESHRRALERLEANIHSVEEEFQARLPGGERDDFQHPPHRLMLVEKNVPRLFRAAELASYRELIEQGNALQQSAPKGLERALAVRESGVTPPEMHLLIRGNPHAPGPVVAAGYPEVLDESPPDIRPNVDAGTSGRRTALANWIVSGRNPLTARVIANRVWQYHFGEGLVATPSNFGLHGDPPSHPELLDWLACELMDNAWRLKHLHRLIMNSAAYQMSSHQDDASSGIDPENQWVSRFNPRRLTAEEIRDSILSVGGTLNRQIGGPSVFPKIAPEVLAGQSRPGEGWGESTPEQASRRSLYVFVKRSLVEPMIASFDGADTDFACPVRFVTTQPTQSLSMLNGPFVREQAATLQSMVEQSGPDDLATRVRRVLELVWQRDIEPAEVERGMQLIGSLVDEDGLGSSQAFHSFCVVALNSNEFVYLD